MCYPHDNQGLSLSPNLSGRKTTGTLEAHRNGLRFTSSKNEKLDILYSNIKVRRSYL